MDQVKVILALLKKHHFWVLCGVSVILAMGVWWTATAGLADKIDSRKKELDGVHKNVQGISAGGTHPNQECITEIEARHSKLTGNVYVTWEEQYLAQKKRNQWPSELGDVRLYIEALDPGDEIPGDYRETYKYFIQNHFPELGKIVDVRLPAKKDERGEIIRDAEGKPVKIDPFENSTGAGRMTGGSMMGSMMGEYGGGDETGAGMPGSGGGYTAATRAGGDDLVGKVDWSKADQSRIRDGLYWVTTPTTDEVRLAQEDLWIYKALLRIIAKTNDAATSYYNAPIKRIDALEIGRMAGAAFAQSRGRATGGGGGMGSGGGMYTGAEGSDAMMGGGMEAGMDPMGGMGSGGMGMGMGMGGEEGYAAAMGGAPGVGMGSGGTASSATTQKDRLLNLRYVDQNGIPLKASDPEPFAEFKMMPVRMLLLMDQRRVSRLLVNCANSAMPVEVRQVTLNAGSGGALNLGRSGAGSGAGGSMGAGMGPMGGLGSQYAGAGGDEGAGSYGGFGSGAGAMTQGRGKQASYDVPVEVQGIIYIFNRPDEDKLGTGAGTAPAADTPPAGPATTPPTEPATTPPAGPATAPPAGPAAAPPAGPAAAPPAGPAATPPTGPATTPPAGGPAATTPATPPVAGAGNP